MSNTVEKEKLQDVHNIPNEYIISGKKETIIQRFLRYFGKHKTPNDLVNFLAMLEDEIVEQEAPDGNYYLSEQIENEILEFTEYFLSEFNDVTQAERYLRWGNEDAFILNLADKLFTEKANREANEALSAFPEPIQKEITSLADTLILSDKNRLIMGTFYVGDGQLDYEMFSLEAQMDADESSFYKNCIICMLCRLIQSDGKVSVQEETEDGISIYGYKFWYSPIGTIMWVPIDKEELEDENLSTASGQKLDPDEGVTFECRPRERF